MAETLDGVVIGGIEYQFAGSGGGGTGGSGNIDAMDDDSQANLNIGDMNGNVLVEFKGGHIKTKEFDSRQGSGNVLQYESSLGQDCEIITAASVMANQTITSEKYPYHIKRGLTMSFYAKFSTFTSLILGKGYNKYRGQWFEIDGTNIVQCKYESSRSVVNTIAHGLTLSTFVKIALYHDESGKCNFILQSLGGYYQGTFNCGYEWNYAAFVTFGGAMSDVKWTLGNNTFKKPIWMFGDSYFGVDTSRWPGCLKNMGYFNYHINGLAGQACPGAYADIVRTLNFGTPKYLVWALGMNGSDSDWSTYTERVKTLCADKKINLILTTIPTVPTRNKETITTSVRSSGYRYIDFYSAMGTNSSGEWYDGMLASDGVHPTSIGAQTLATQVLIDFPELMQYGNSKSGDIEGNNGNDK